MRQNTSGQASSIAELHRAWLTLVDSDGPFLAVAPLKRVWPQGMPQLVDDAKAALSDAKPTFENAWEKWDLHRDDESARALYREARDTWVDVVLREVLGWADSYKADLSGAALAHAARGVRSPDHAVTVTPTGALVRGETVGALVLVVDPVDSLRDPYNDDWATSPIDRMEDLLRQANVPIGVVTDGRWWAIVSARKDTMAASGVVDAQTWIEEPTARNAFVELLQRKRLIGGRPEDRLTELFRESVAAAEEITESLGVQVRRAVELLVRAISESALDARRRGDPDALPARPQEVYEAAVTVMMRVVFLLFAEERSLLPQGRLFSNGYGISDRYDILDQREREESPEALDATYLTWHRLLATSAALYQGASFEDIRIPAYGGSLFDPDRFPFLTARSKRGALAIAVNDRVMLEVLRAVQIARVGGEARRISFRDIDVEQIGYIYEGLLGYSCEHVDEATVGLIGTDGAEPEITLAALEAMAQEHTDDGVVDGGSLADAILADVKRTQPASKPSSRSALLKGLHTPDPNGDAERALRAVTTDAGLRDRLRPYLGIIRRDLRDRPFVLPPGGLVVVETPSRATAGAHYTPRRLAEEVVRYTLEPLVYDPGPHQTAESDDWEPVSSDRILDLKVADIACGSGAFLVAAARYLGTRLIAAWHREGVAAASSPHELQIRAVREVVAQCLYGADINAMAVEMCKLSLWLVSLDPKLPFSFVDDKVLHGNSLLGLTDKRQLERLHVYPDDAGDDQLFHVGADTRGVWRVDVDRVLKKAASLRRRLATEVSNDDPQRLASTKRRQWREYQELTAQLSTIADAVVATGLRLGGKPGKKLNVVYDDLRIAVGAAFPEDGSEPDHAMLDGILTGLEPTVPTDYDRWKPLHWILAVPDVMEAGGFDAVIGNPPFRGSQKLTGDIGTNVRDWLVNVVASGRRGIADIVAYFFRRAFGLLKTDGGLGLIGTSTLWQGDTREVGLDQLTDEGFTITRSVQSMSWPVKQSASLEVALVWGTRAQVADAVPRHADGMAASRISTLLEPVGRTEGNPVRLVENSGIAFVGCYVLGMGFVIEPETAAAWIEDDARNASVLFPYLNGEDLNERPDYSASRWVIDFNDSSRVDAASFALPYEHVHSRVKPERERNNRKVYRERWWQYAERRPAMRAAIAGRDEVIVIAQVSKTLRPTLVSAHQVLDAKLIVFATSGRDDLAVLSSSAHQLWAIKYGTTMRTDATYTSRKCFETFPRPQETDRLFSVGWELDTVRREIMLRRELGLTKLYNLVNDPDIADSADQDVAVMRQIHVDLDHAVLEAYGWDDVSLDHGFHTYRQAQRWTVSPAARVEILDRLLEENHRRAAEQDDVPADVTDDGGHPEDEE